MPLSKWLPLEVSWTLVLGLNLIIPLPVGLSTVEGGQFGVGLAIFAWWVFGLAVARLRASLLRPVVVGGLFVALSQFYPMLQFGAGMLAINFGGWLVRGMIPVSDNLAGFGLTAVTGGELIAVAYLIGTFLESLTGSGPAIDSDAWGRRGKMQGKSPSEQELL